MSQLLTLCVDLPVGVFQAEVAKTSSMRCFAFFHVVLPETYVYIYFFINCLVSVEGRPLERKR